MQWSDEAIILSVRPHGETAAVVDRLRELGARVETGRFRTDMAVALVNDGPVTLIVEV